MSWRPAGGQEGPGREPRVRDPQACRLNPSPFPLLKQKSSNSPRHHGHSSAWSSTRRPRCPAQPRAARSPLLSGSGQVGALWAWGGGGQAAPWADMGLSQAQLSAWYCGTDRKGRGRFIVQLEEESQTQKRSGYGVRQCIGSFKAPSGWIGPDRAIKSSLSKTVILSNIKVIL